LTTAALRVKELVEKVQARGHRQGSEHLRNYRTWGWHQTIDSGPRFQVKRIAVRPGFRLSLQAIITGPSIGSWCAVPPKSPSTASPSFHVGIDVAKATAP
jgi:hypothetical protein